MDEDLNLRELAKGYLFLKIRAEDTEHNASVLKAFRDLAAIECRNDYTLALKRLLEYYENDGKIELIWLAINAIERRVDEMERALAEERKRKENNDDEGAF